MYSLKWLWLDVSNMYPPSNSHNMLGLLKGKAPKHQFFRISLGSIPPDGMLGWWGFDSRHWGHHWKNRTFCSGTSSVHQFFGQCVGRTSCFFHWLLAVMLGWNQCHQFKSVIVGKPCCHVKDSFHPVLHSWLMFDSALGLKRFRFTSQWDDEQTSSI